MRKSLLVSVFFAKKTLKKYVDMFLACPKSKVTIKLKFYYSNLKNAVETTNIAVDSCYVLRQFLTSLPSIDFREIRGLVNSSLRRLRMPPVPHIMFIVITFFQNIVISYKTMTIRGVHTQTNWHLTVFQICK
jgi:hypothetical protein